MPRFSAISARAALGVGACESTSVPKTKNNSQTAVRTSRLLDNPLHVKERGVQEVCEGGGPAGIQRETPENPRTKEQLSQYDWFRSVYLVKQAARRPHNDGDGVTLCVAGGRARPAR